MYRFKLCFSVYFQCDSTSSGQMINCSRFDSMLVGEVNKHLILKLCSPFFFKIDFFFINEFNEISFNFGEKNCVLDIFK